MATATFGAGCFWGVEAAFARVPGVRSTAVGYAGGSPAAPTDHEIRSGRTGHAEVVQIDYDPETVGYPQLLDLFWASHDPTQLDRQGPDVGSQYRSVIFVHDPEQEALARAAKAERDRSGRHKRPIVTEITPFSSFHRAEEHHQKYLAKRGLATDRLR
jgi:peptide-methionine (S)-S-oxide reductase